MMDDVPVTIYGDWRDSSSYARAMEHAQRGEWSQALTLLRALQADYPTAQGLQSLLAEAELRLAMEQRGRIKAPRLPKINRRVLFVVVLIALVIALGLLASNLYRGVVLPAAAQAQVKQTQDGLAAQAAQAVASKDYTRALELYEQLAALNPTHPALAENPAKVRQTIAVEQLYQEAQAQFAAGQIDAAQAMLVQLQAMQPNYRDVQTMLTKIERQQRLNALARQAAEFKAAGDWEGVIARQEEARALMPREERGPAQAELFQAYATYGAELVQQTQSGSGELLRAVEMFNKALALRPGAADVTTQRNRARQYLAGSNAYTAGNWSGAIAQLEPLYAEQPGYLGGQAAQLLYNAYMRRADALAQDNEMARAWEFYTRASKLQSVDTSTARALAANLELQLTPTATITPTPTPRPAATLTPVPSATPTPGYVPLTRYRGKIVFWSNASDQPLPTPIPGTPVAPGGRGGQPSLWIMDPDGKNRFRLWQQDKAQAEYKKLQEAERRSPDGLSSLYVTNPMHSKTTQLYLLDPDGKSFQLTDYDGLQYDPVWSPKGFWIAFVSNEPGNDEIFLVGRDGEHPKRLTWNDWEWDKHPSWSPDGGRLIFWSNRVTGYGQIWLMNDDGSYQINLSNNDFEEYDPIWIK
jgi:outer membrane protein assembly factor BamD (BamD/ComL family)